MKKIFLALLAITILTGCNINKKKNNNIEKNLLDEIVLDDTNANYICSIYNKDFDEYDIAGKYAIYLDDNEFVNKIESTEIIESNNYDLLKDFESYYNSNYEKISNYGGYTYDIYQKNNQVISNVIIDFNTLNMESYASEYEEINQYLNEEFKITKDKILEKYNSQNIKCQKK